MFQPHTWPLISEPRREGRTGEGIEVAGGRGDQPWTCLQGPSSKVCTVLPVRDPTPQLTALLDHTLCTKDAQRDPRPSPAPTPQPPVTGSSAKLRVHNQSYTQPASVTLTDDLGAGKGHIRVAILSPRLDTNPQNMKSLPQYTHTTSSLQSVTPAHSQPTSPKAHTHSRLPGPQVQCHIRQALILTQKQPRDLQDVKFQKATQTHARRSHTVTHGSQHTCLITQTLNSPAHLMCTGTPTCVGAQHPDGPLESQADAKGYTH